MKNNILLIIIGLCLIGCSKDNDFDGNKEQIDDSEYYVKYHFTVSGGNHYCFFEVVYIDSDTTNPNNVYRTITYYYPNLSTHYNKEIVCGPFKYGDLVSLETNKESNVIRRVLEIYVSKDGSPFVLKNRSESSFVDFAVGN